ncbi:hypothetical protein BDR04DRAFT_1119043 [Suillus decipiens]|nr:hypothetical protein BDR04DRAFT_1119043 [Suillus decipiens]
MVKSKQTCKKSTGGTAPHVTLKLLVPTAVPAAQEVTICELLQHNEYCIICQDGSVGEERLFLCSLCPRAMCLHSSDCFDLACDFLHPYFPTGGFEVCTIVFDIGNALKVKSYQSKASAIVQALKSSWMCTVIAITNHTDNDHGDPFVGYEGKKKVYVSAHIHSVLDILLSPWHRLIDDA